MCTKRFHALCYQEYCVQACKMNNILGTFHLLICFTIITIIYRHHFILPYYQLHQEILFSLDINFFLSHQVLKSSSLHHVSFFATDVFLILCNNRDTFPYNSCTRKKQFPLNFQGGFVCLMDGVKLNKKLFSALLSRWIRIKQNDFRIIVTNFWVTRYSINFCVKLFLLSRKFNETCSSYSTFT